MCDLTLSQCRSNGGRAGVVDCFAKNVIDFHSMGRRAIDQGCRAAGSPPAQCESRAAVVQVFAEGGFQQR